MILFEVASAVYQKQGGLKKGFVVKNSEDVEIASWIARKGFYLDENNNKIKD